MKKEINSSRRGWHQRQRWLKSRDKDFQSYRIFTDYDVTMRFTTSTWFRDVWLVVVGSKHVLQAWSLSASLIWEISQCFTSLCCHHAGRTFLNFFFMNCQGEIVGTVLLSLFKKSWQPWFFATNHGDAATLYQKYILFKISYKQYIITEV